LKSLEVVREIQPSSEISKFSSEKFVGKIEKFDREN